MEGWLYLIIFLFVSFFLLINILRSWCFLEYVLENITLDLIAGEKYSQRFGDQNQKYIVPRIQWGKGGYREERQWWNTPKDQEEKDIRNNLSLETLSKDERYKGTVSLLIGAQRKLSHHSCAAIQLSVEECLWDFPWNKEKFITHFKGPLREPLLLHSWRNLNKRNEGRSVPLWILVKLHSH